MEFHPEKFKLIIVKAGTNVLTDSDGRLDPEAMEGITEGLAQLWRQGKSVVLVTSGAIASGMSSLGMRNKPKEVSLQQACAATGQPALMNLYGQLFSRHGIVCAQVLLTTDDFTIRERYLDMIGVLQALLRARVIPVINENDAVSHRELLKRENGAAVFSDNDELSALVASRMRADLLVLLTDVDGLYDDNPKKNAGSTLIRRVELITPELELGAGKGSAAGRGGMKSKLGAARMAASFGTWVAIANGRKGGIIQSVLMQEEGTLFVPSNSGLSGKGQWIAYASQPSGSVEVDALACKALVQNNASLLAIGVVSSKGSFSKGDIVNVVCKSRSVARGRVNYSSSELAAIAGKRSGEIRGILGRGGDVISRENLVLLGKGEGDG